MSATVLPILLPVPLDRPLDYRAEAPIPVGSFVRVALGSRETVGVVWDGPPGSGRAPARLKPVLGKLEAPALPEPLRRFLEAAASETLTPLGSMLRLVSSVSTALEPEPLPLGYRTAGGARPRSALERRVLAALAEAGTLPAAELARLARTSRPALARLAEAGLLQPVVLAPPAEPRPDPDRAGPRLTAEQAAAARALIARVEQGSGVVLLEGVPGSGKTEVYFEAIAATLRRGKRVLVLLPEIALTAQWLERFVQRFGVEPQLWHSGLTATQRRKGWRRIAEGRAPVVVGARSALFLPLAELGLLVVDEEHDPSFKQDEGVVYHARELALLRARLEGCPVVLVSATPSLEVATAAGAVPGGPPARPGWSHLVLADRWGGAAMPTIELVDLRRERPPRGAFLSPPVRAALTATLGAGEQALLFLNRRGFAPLTFATPAGIVCAARAAPHGSPLTACAVACCATIAAGRRRSPSIAPPAARSAPWWPRARVSSGSPRRPARSCPGHGSPSSRATRSTAPGRPAKWSAPSSRASSTCSWAPRCWPRGTISRGSPSWPWSTPISASGAATREPPSAASNSSSRWPGGQAAPIDRAGCSSRRTIRTIRSWRPWPGAIGRHSCAPNWPSGRPPVSRPSAGSRRSW